MLLIHSPEEMDFPCAVDGAFSAAKTAEELTAKAARCRELEADLALTLAANEASETNSAQALAEIKARAEHGKALAVGWLSSSFGIQSSFNNNSRRRNNRVKHRRTLEWVCSEVL